MKNCQLTIILLFFSIFSFGQNAPDFTVNTNHGDVLSLYSDFLDQGKTVVLDFMFDTCPPCIAMAPLMENIYQDWGAGAADVEFLAVSPSDTNAALAIFENTYNLSYHGVGTDGGSAAVLAPYLANTWGTFYGYPTIVVIAPDRSVTFDVWGSSYTNTIALLDQAIEDTGATGQVALSIELTDFSGHTTNDGVVLEWSTASETNNKGFEIMRSFDATSFRAINFQDGAFSTVNTSKYSHTDLQPQIGDNYYKIVSVDVNGNKQHSHVIQLSWNGKKEISIFPNPISNNELRFISNDANQNVELFQIINQLGQVVMKDHVQGNAGQFSIDCRSFETGVYTLQIGIGANMQTKQFSVN